MDVLISALLPQAPTLAAVLAMAWLVWSRLLKLESRLDAIEHQQEEAKAERAEILAEVHKLQVESAETKARLTRVEGWISSVSDGGKELRSEIGALRERVAALEAQDKRSA